MSIIHRTTMNPTKVELLATWLPGRSWFLGKGRPEPVRRGGFRLDDPAGEVGIEFMIVSDDADPRSPAYHVPLTYRAAPLEGAEEGLVGTSQHGVLGLRWIYDASHDPVFLERCLALLHGSAAPQAQRVSDTPDPTVVVRPTAGPEGAQYPTSRQEGGRETVLRLDGAELRVHRVLEPGSSDGKGEVTVPYLDAAGQELRAVLLSLTAR